MGVHSERFVYLMNNKDKRIIWDAMDFLYKAYTIRVEILCGNWEMNHEYYSHIFINYVPRLNKGYDYWGKYGIGFIV